MFLKSLLGWVLIGLAASTMAQDVAFTGVVSSRGKPVEFAHVVLKETSQGATTDEVGSFNFNVFPGRYTLQVSSVGYKTFTKVVTVGSAYEPLVIELEEDTGTLDEIVITGTMREVTKLQSPIPVEVYSPVLFRKNPTPNIFESLNLINGVQPQVNCNVCNTGDIHINGLEGPYTMVLIDGMPIVSSLSTVYGLSGIPNSLVKRIEIVKGPASTLYGSEAVGGLINIITVEPAGATTVHADVYGTSVGEFNADVATAFKLGKLSSLLGINAFTYQQLRDINNDNFTDLPLQQRYSLFNKWSMPLRGGKNASLAWRYFNEDRWGGELLWTKAYRGTDVYYGESINTNRWEVIGYYPLADKLGFDYSYNYHHQDSYYGTVKYLARQHVAFTQLRWNHTAGKHNLLAGAPFRYMYYDDNTPGTGDEDGMNTPAITWLPGIFLQDEWNLSRAVTLLTGLRYDHHNIHGSILTPRISLKYSPGQSSVFRLTGGNGYRVVNLFTEDHAALTGSREVVILNELKPEQSWNVNLNYSRHVSFASGFVMFDGSVFYTYFTNKIVGDFLTDPDKIIYDNLDGHSISKGVTLNADAQFINGFKAMLGVTVMDVYNIDNLPDGDEKVPQLFAPRFSGTMALSWSTVGSDWMIDLTGRINGPMHLPVLPNDFRPDMSPVVPLINLQVTRKLTSKNEKHAWEIYGGVKNLLNFIPNDPLMRPFDPFDRSIDLNNPNGYTFDTAYNYAPVQGLKGFFGVRYTLR
ncbi:MAG: TonB-dependent receptor plug domain-containing protein [Cyclobacteriaceae bacterium]|nr:TonB-dependent receptor plug domain-containing protein [Cyclobacteriaceae bacterium]